MIPQNLRLGHISYNRLYDWIHNKKKAQPISHHKDIYFHKIFPPVYSREKFKQFIRFPIDTEENFLGEPYLVLRE